MVSECLSLTMSLPTLSPIVYQGTRFQLGPTKMVSRKGLFHDLLMQIYETKWRAWTEIWFDLNLSCRLTTHEQIGRNLVSCSQVQLPPPLLRVPVVTSHVSRRHHFDRYSCTVTPKSYFFYFFGNSVRINVFWHPLHEEPGCKLNGMAVQYLR